MRTEQIRHAEPSKQTRQLRQQCIHKVSAMGAKVMSAGKRVRTVLATICSCYCATRFCPSPMCALEQIKQSSCSFNKPSIKHQFPSSKHHEYHLGGPLTTSLLAQGRQAGRRCAVRSQAMHKEKRMKLVNLISLGKSKVTPSLPKQSKQAAGLRSNARKWTKRPPVFRQDSHKYKAKVPKFWAS